MKKIACIGNTVYDVVGYTESFPIENFRTNYKLLIEGVGGPASNAASVIKKLGNEVDFYGKIGNDVYGKSIVSCLTKEGINIEHLELKDNFHTPFSFVIVAEQNNTRTINTYREKSDFDNPLIEPTKDFENNYDIILTDGKYPNDFFILVELILKP